MRWCVFLMIIGCGVSYATNSYAQTTVLSLNLKNTTVKEVFAEIEKHSEYIFFYYDGVLDLERKVSINLKNQKIDIVLDKLFEGTNNEYVISDRQITISRKPEAIPVLPLPPAGTVQQGINITGSIVDGEGVLMPGVNVVIKGTTTGAVSDVNGRYSIFVPGKEAILQFSFMGYRTQEVMVGEQSLINVTLMEVSQDIEEVVVVAYGSQKKLTVTGSIATVQTKELKQSSAANLSVALSGRMPGLTALQSSGMPGNDYVRMYLRGMGTVNGVDPLILIDGVPRDNINVLDPNEVASISILKDASSTAVFGVRGANGVILVTTRRGNIDKPELNVTAEFSLQSMSTRFDRIHSWEYAELRNQAARNDGVEETKLPFTPYMIQKFKDGSDRVFYPDRDIFHDYFHDFSPQTRFNLNYSGGTDKIRYFINAGYIGQQGLVKTESKKDLGYDPAFKMNRYSFRANVDYKIFDNLKVTANMATYMEQMNSPNVTSLFLGDINSMVGQMMAYCWATPPSWPGPVTVAGYGVPENMIVDRNIGQSSWYGQLNRMGYNSRTSTQLNTSVGLEWGLDFITKGLSTKAMISYDGTYSTSLTGSRSHQLYSFYMAQTADETSHYTTLKGPDIVDESITLSKYDNISKFYMNFQYSLDYVRQFGRHNVTGMYLLQRDNWESYTLGELPYNILGMSGRITYNYDQRYLAEFNVGYNGSEQFHKDHRFGFFPAFSAGWVVSNENFLKDNHLLTYLKVRASYGKVGSDKLGSDRFLYRTKVSEIEGPYSQLDLNKQIVQGKMGNELLSWETAKKQNYGFDIQLFHGFSLSMDIFHEQRNNVLLVRNTVPIFQGVPISDLPKVNIGKIKNYGYETEATYYKRLGNGLSYTVKGNFAYNRNKQIYMDEVILPDDYAVRYRYTGYSIGQYFGYKIDKSNGNGYINTPEELDWAKASYKMGTPRLGDFKYLDKNDDGFIDDKDRMPIGYHHVPRISYGFSGSIEYKGLDLSFLFTGIAQSNTNLGWGINESGLEGFYTDLHRNAWTEERYRNHQKITYPALSTGSSVSQGSNDFFILNRSFIRLKNIELGYCLPERWLNHLNISRVRIYINGNNLWNWNKLPIKTVDPEQTTSQVIPVNRMYNFGLNISF